jgi:hypothetical protein
MATYWPVSIPEHGVGLNITVMSYAGAMGFGFTAAANAVPDAGPLATAVAAALDELLARTAQAAAKPKRRSAPAGRTARPAGKAAKRTTAGTARTQVSRAPARGR